jgi:spermidine synthase
MAAAFIAGLALGSAAGTPLSRRVARPGTWLAWMLIAGAMASMTAAWYAASRLPFVVAAQVGDPAAVFSNIVGAQALAVGLLLLPSTLALGATFPLALAVAARGEETVAGDAAGVYTANTLGAILGALVAGFVLIPMLGLRTTFQVAAIVSVLGGAACWIAAKTRKRPSTGSGQAPAVSDVEPWVRGQSVLLPGRSARPQSP